MEADMNTDSSMNLSAIGVVHNTIKKSMMVADKEGLTLMERIKTIRANRRQVQETVSELVIDPKWEELLDGIDSFSHILVLYWPHLIDPVRRNLKKVHPMGRKDLPSQGIFATCSPARPNPVMVSAVRLMARKGNVLEVKGLDAVDGSPIIDLKPYSKSYLKVKDLIVPAWMERLNKELEEDSP
jgi:tRNA-Thr(GGU) m(6)t(6)A37 methyltransferase TsaA